MADENEAWLALVGLGLGPGGIPVAGLEAAKQASHVYLEAYTAIAPEPIEALEDRLGCSIEPLGRARVEDATVLLEAARDGGCCLLVAGDPLSATTHTSLRMQAQEAGIAVEIHFAASILTAASGLAGTSHYKFGRTTTLVTPQPGYFPESPYDAIRANQEAGLHTLVLLDIQEDGTCMTAAEGAGVLLDLAHKRGDGVLEASTEVLAVARAGRADAAVYRGTLEAISELDAGAPMHSLILPGELSAFEREAIEALAGRVG